jgi:DNA-binding CsgD family transcriptional regulator
MTERNGVAANELFFRRLALLKPSRSRGECNARLQTASVGYFFQGVGLSNLGQSLRLLGDSAGVALTTREQQVFVALKDGLRSTDIAKRLKISIKTVTTYVARIREKTGLTKANIVSFDADALLREAADFIQQERDSLFQSFEVDGVLDDTDVALEISNMDTWLKRSKEITG